MKLGSLMRGALLLVVTAVAAVVLTTRIDAFLETAKGTHWGEAIQATSTVLLVAITALYAYYTFRLVKNQEVDIARRGEEPIVRDTVVLVGYAVESRMYQLVRVFEVDTMQPPDDKLTDLLDTEWMDGLHRALTEKVGQLSQMLRTPCQDFMTRCQRARRDTRLLRDALTHESLQATAAGRPFDWANARQYFAGTLRDTLPEGERPEWEQLTRGTAVKEFARAQEVFAKRLDVYLHPGAERDDHG
jgi:hypothetical protein